MLYSDVAFYTAKVVPDVETAYPFGPVLPWDTICSFSPLTSWLSLLEGSYFCLIECSCSCRWKFWKRNIIHIKWDPCNHSMLNPQVVDGSPNILNKKLWTDDKGWSSSLGIVWWLTALDWEKPGYYEVSLRVWDLDGLFRMT